jgi:hypothetical protein
LVESLTETKQRKNGKAIGQWIEKEGVYGQVLQITYGDI